MRKHNSQLAGRFGSIAKPPAIIFGAALLHIVVTYIWVMRWRQEYGGGPYASGRDLGILLVEPFLLLVSAAMLFFGAWWSRLIALAISLWLLYFLGCSGLLAVSYAHDIPLFSVETGRRWFQMTWLMQSQVFAQLALAGAITIYVLASFYSFWREGEVMRGSASNNGVHPTADTPLVKYLQWCGAAGDAGR